MRIGVDVDMEQVQDALEPIPAGQYAVRVDVLDVRASKGGASTQVLHLEYLVLEGEFVNRRVFDNVGLSKDAAWRLKQLLKAAKVGYSVVGGRTEFDTDDLQGALLGINVTQKVYEDRPQNKVASYVIPSA